MDLCLHRISYREPSVRSRSAALASVFLAAAISPLDAAALSTLDSRESIAHVDYGGGFAIRAKYGEDGSTVPETSLTLNRTLTLTGADSYDADYVSWNVHWEVSWSQTQTFDVLGSPAAFGGLQASGSQFVTQSSAVTNSLLGTTDPATLNITSTNAQVFEFTVGQATGFELSGTTTGGQYLELSRWDEPGGRWVWYETIDPLRTTDRAFSFSNTFVPGRYRIGNNANGFKADGSPLTHDASWDYALVLPSAVPEPAESALLLAGLGVIGLQLRRRRGWRPRQWCKS